MAPNGLIVGLATSILGITSSYANRCIWDSVFNKVECLRSNPDHTGNRCIWDNYFSMVICCPIGKEAIWNEFFNKKECY